MSASSFQNHGPISNQAGHQIINGNLINTIQYTPGAPAPPPRLKPLLLIPYRRDKHFIPREEIFEQISSGVDACEPVILCGLGGTGKSQIAIEYAYRFKERYPQSSVLWIYAGSTASILQTYHDIARRLQLPGFNDPHADVCQLVQDWLDDVDEDDDALDQDDDVKSGSGHLKGKQAQAARKRWLLIVDNVDTTSVLQQPLMSGGVGAGTANSAFRPLHDYLPNHLTPWRVMVVTSRSRDVARSLSGGEAEIEIRPFSLLESRALFRQRLQTDRSGQSMLEISSDPEIDKLLAKLGHLPLAITQATAFIARNSITTSQFSAKLDKDDLQLASYLSQDIQDPRRARGWPNAVFRTWRLSFEVIQAEHPLAAQILAAIAFLNGQQIPGFLLLFIINQSGSPVEMAIGVLLSYSLLARRASDEALSVHPLVQASVRAWLRAHNQFTKYASQTLQAISLAFPMWDGTYDTLARCRTMLPHAMAVLVHNEGEPVETDARSELLLHMIYHEQACGNYVSALVRAQSVHEEVCRAHGKESLRSCETLTLIGSLQGHLGKHKIAEEVLRRVLLIREQKEGMEHPHTIASMTNLAQVLAVQMKYDLAENLQRKAVARLQQRRSKHRVETVECMKVLGTIIRAQGKYKAAEEMLQETLSLSTDVYGMEHMTTLFVMHSLALVFMDQRKYQDAEKMNQRVLSAYTRVLGEEHPDTMASANNQAMILTSQGRHGDAEKIYHAVLATHEKTSRAAHLTIMTSMNNLAASLSHQHKHEAAEIMCQRVFKLSEKQFGSEHTVTLMYANNLTAVMLNQRKYQAAEPLCRHVLSCSEKVYGPEHPDTLDSVQKLAVVLSSMQAYEEANTLFLRALAGLRKIDKPGTRLAEIWVMQFQASLAQQAAKIATSKKSSTV